MAAFSIMSNNKFNRVITGQNVKKCPVDIFSECASWRMDERATNVICLIPIAIGRGYQHKAKTYKGFTYKYNCDKLVYFEKFDDINQAIAREKQIKSGSRKRKDNLINSNNPEWNDLSDGWLFYFD